MVRLTGDWTINGNFASAFPVADLGDLVTTKVPDILGGGSVDDFSATVNANREACDPFLRLAPFGPDCQNYSQETMSKIIQDGDVLTFVAPKLEMRQASNADLIGSLKQRGNHTELCYRDGAGIAKQVAVWWEYARDAPCDAITGDLGRLTTSYFDQKHWLMHIYRIKLPGVDLHQWLKQVKLWSQIFEKHDFPNYGDLFPGSHVYLDPADVASIEEVESIAKALICRTRDEVPKIPKVTCVQWAYEVLCLSLNVPLNQSSLEQLGVWEEFKRIWLGYEDFGRMWQECGVDPALTGIGRLPFLPYSPAQVLQEFLTTYAQEKSLISLLGDPTKRRYLESLLTSQLHAELPPFIAGYLDEVCQSGRLDLPLRVPGRPPYRFLLPISFFTEARSAISRDSSAPWFQYVATAVYQDYLEPLTDFTTS